MLQLISRLCACRIKASR